MGNRHHLNASWFEGKPMAHARARSAGFTLIELVMVLIILAILATAALSMVEVQVDQTRFEMTQQTVGVIQRAVLGPDHARAADGSPAVSGFVADCGRLPLSLEELYMHPDSLYGSGQTFLPAFASGSPAGDTEVTVTGGWNGPYLQLAIGGQSLPDGWAAGFEQFQSDGTASDPTQPVAILRSLGRDLAVGGTDYDADISLVFQADAVIPGLTTQVENRWQKPLTVYVYYYDSVSMTKTNPPNPMDEQKKIVVRVYGPVADETGVVTLGTIAQSITDYASEGPVSIPLSNLPVGPRIIRVYQLDTATDPTTTEELSDHADLQAVSVPTRLVVSRETSSVQLILRDKLP